MRTFEAWACGGCLLVENTEDHQEIFEPVATEPCVSYFRTPAEAAVQAKYLVSSTETRDTLRRRLSSEALHAHSYMKRLQSIVQCLPVRDDSVLSKISEES